MKQLNLDNRLAWYSLGPRFAAIAIFCAAIGGCDPMHDYTEWYKPVEVIRANDAKELGSRFYPVSIPDGVVNLEWYTYDNKEFKKGPYKLFVVLEPLTESLQRVEILRITVSSSLGKQYDFDLSQKWPVVLASKGPEYPTSHQFEPAFAFAYHENEIIHTEILLRTTNAEGVTEQLLKIDWGPVRVRHFSPLV
jgi:hypothetical protein